MSSSRSSGNSSGKFPFKVLGNCSGNFPAVSAAKIGQICEGPVSVPVRDQGSGQVARGQLRACSCWVTRSAGLGRRRRVLVAAPGRIVGRTDLNGLTCGVEVRVEFLGAVERPETDKSVWSIVRSLVVPSLVPRSVPSRGAKNKCPGGIFRLFSRSFSRALRFAFSPRAHPAVVDPRKTPVLRGFGAVRPPVLGDGSPGP